MSSDNVPDAMLNETLIISLIPVRTEVSVDSVCQLILTEFPGAVITAQNSFEAKRFNLEALRQVAQERLRQGTLEPWAWKTMDELNTAFDQSIVHNRHVEVRCGPRKDLTIPLNNGTQLHGHVGAKSILFLGQCHRSDETVAHLALVLDLLNIGKVEILTTATPPSPESRI